MLIELFLAATLLISMVVGCKKKDNASKLKPRDMDKGVTIRTRTPIAGGTPAIKKTEADAAAAAKKEEPVDKSLQNMPERPADDNETINDAKSNWGTVS